MKIAAYLVSNGRLLCLAFLYGRHFLNRISLDCSLTLTTEPSALKLSDNPGLLEENASLRRGLDAGSNRVRRIENRPFASSKTLTFKARLGALNGLLTVFTFLTLQGFQNKGY